jgi:succinoglycan biosynthesis protein ExoM
MTMPRIAIGICTYRRPEGLSRLLQSLQHLALRVSDDDVCVVIVDNSPEGSARALCDEKAATSRFRFRYVNESRKGLSNARNAVIAEARAAGTKLLAFIDDDEMAPKAWLQALLDTNEKTGAIIAAGPSYPFFANAPERWMPIEVYAFARQEKGGFVDDASSANMLIDIERLGRLGLQFDMSFNETGGEDTHLISKLLAAGEKIAWSGDAAVWDSIPIDRMRPIWLFRRWYRTGTTEARLSEDGSRTLLGRVPNVAKGIVRLGYGSFRILGGALSALAGAPQRLTASCYTFCRGAGYLASAFGHSFKEYGNRHYR